jgi:hypothetical protein
MSLSMLLARDSNLGIYLVAGRCADNLAMPHLSKAILLLSHASVQLSYALPHLQGTPHPNLATSHPDLGTPHSNLVTPDPNLDIPHPNLATPHPNLARPSHQEASNLNLFVTWKASLPPPPPPPHLSLQSGHCVKSRYYLTTEWPTYVT